MGNPFSTVTQPSIRRLYRAPQVNKSLTKPVGEREPSAYSPPAGGGFTAPGTWNGNPPTPPVPPDMSQPGVPPGGTPSQPGLPPVYPHPIGGGINNPGPEQPPQPDPIEWIPNLPPVESPNPGHIGWNNNSPGVSPGVGTGGGSIQNPALQPPKSGSTENPEVRKLTDVVNKLRESLSKKGGN